MRFCTYKASWIMPDSLGPFAIGIALVCAPMQVTYADHIERVSISATEQQANNWSFFCDISADGQIVAFESDASNLIQTDTNNRSDIFVRNRKLSDTIRVSVSSGGTQANSDSYKPGVSADDGSAVSFVSFADNFVDNDTNEGNDVFVFSLNTSVTGDINGDGVVSTADLLILFSQWGACDDCNSCPADLNGDCTVSTADLLLLFSNWG